MNPHEPWDLLRNEGAAVVVSSDRLEGYEHRVRDRCGEGSGRGR